MVKELSSREKTRAIVLIKYINLKKKKTFLFSYALWNTSSISIILKIWDGHRKIQHIKNWMVRAPMCTSLQEGPTLQKTEDSMYSSLILCYEKLWVSFLCSLSHSIYWTPFEQPTLIPILQMMKLSHRGGRQLILNFCQWQGQGFISGNKLINDP